MAESWAVKYRPASWTDVTGNELTAKILANAINRDITPPAVFLSGNRGSGKCFYPGQLVLTPEGYRRGTSFMKENLSFYTEGFSDCSIPLINSTGNTEIAKSFYNNGKKYCMKITCENGTEFIVTPNHCMLALPSGDAQISDADWYRADRLIPGKHFLLFPVNTNCFSDTPVPLDSFTKVPFIQGVKVISPFMAQSLGKLTGLYAASEYIADKYREENLRADFCTTFFGKSGVEGDFLLMDMLYDMQFDPDNPRVPNVILASPKGVQEMFLRGVYEEAGSDDRGYAETPDTSMLFSSHRFAREVQIMMFNFGRTPKLCHYPDILISPDVYVLNSFRTPPGEDYFTSAVLKTDYTKKPLTTICFSMPETNSFILNGAVSHNTTSARLYAKSLLCENRKEDASPCNSCPSCEAFAQEKHDDYLELDAASQNSVNNIRDITKSLTFGPSRGHYRILLLDEVHSLTSQAQNALLKTLEQPPDYVKFIFCTTDPQKVLETIRSRCMCFSFSAIRDADIIKRLKTIAELEHVNIDDMALKTIAGLSGGAMRNAVMLLEQSCLTHPNAEEMIRSSDILELSGQPSVSDAATLITAVKSGDIRTAQPILEKHAPQDIIKSCIALLETVIFIKEGASPAMFISADRTSVITSVASALNVADVFEMFDAFESMLRDMKSFSSMNVSTLFNMSLRRLSLHLQQPQQAFAFGSSQSPAVQQVNASALLIKLKEKYKIRPI